MRKKLAAALHENRRLASELHVANAVAEQLRTLMGQDRVVTIAGWAFDTGGDIVLRLRPSAVVAVQRYDPAYDWEQSVCVTVVIHLASSARFMLRLLERDVKPMLRDLGWT